MKVATVVLCCVLWIGAASIPSTAGCIGPQLDLVEGSEGRRLESPVMGLTRSGTFLHLDGDYFTTACNDTPDASSGPFGCANEPEPEDGGPMRAMEVVVLGPVTKEILREKRRMRVLNQSGQEYYDTFEDVEFDVSIPLGDIDADEDARLDHRIDLPRLEPGRYLLRFGSFVTQFRVVKMEANR